MLQFHSKSILDPLAWQSFVNATSATSKVHGLQGAMSTHHGRSKNVLIEDISARNRAMEGILECKKT
jgi:hypothetical protein